MRLRLIAIVLALALVGTAAAATGIHATLKAPKTNPKINVKWWYSIKATDHNGHPVKARLTAQIIDPVGGVHPIDYGPSKPPKPITNRPFTGTFRDFITFPPTSRGYPLTLRWTVKAKIGKKTYSEVLTHRVTPG